MTKIGTTQWDASIDLYDVEHDAWTAKDLPFYLAEARQHSPVLELACGTGRLTIPIAKAGVPIVGLDASSKMLARAREKAGDLPNLRFVLGRMEEFDLGQQFGIIFICYSSILELNSVEAQERMFRNIRRHLKKGGRVIMDIFMPSEERFGKPFPHHEPAEKRLVLELQGPTGQHYKVWESAYHIPNEQVFEMERVIQTFDSQGRVVGTPQHAHLRGRYLHRFEIQHLLRLCGFEIVNLFGGFNREPFDRTSKRMVWVATPSTIHS